MARAGLKTDEIKGYRTFLERAFNGEARRSSEDAMSARVVIQTPYRNIDILRRWHFRSPTAVWLEEEATAFETENGKVGHHKTDGKSGFLLSDTLAENFVPAHVAPFFFFDGEEVKKLADQDRIEQVKQGLESLLGVVLLRNLDTRLKSFENNKRADIANVDEQNINQMRDVLTRDETKLASLKVDATKRQQHHDALKTEQNSFIERITAAGGGRGDIATVKELLEERGRLDNKRREVQKTLDRILADKLPFHLMPKNLLDDFQSQLQRETALTAWQAECRTLQPKLAKFEHTFLYTNTPEISPNLTDSQIAAIKVRIEAAWASLFHPAPSNCADTITHTYLHESLRKYALSFIESIDVGQQEVKALLNTQRELIATIEETNRKISRVEGIDRDGTLADLKKNLSRITQEIGDLDARIRHDEREIMSLETTLNNTRARYQQEAKRRDETSPVRQLLNKSERVRAVINEVIPALFPLKTKDLSEAMTRVYKQLAHKEQVARIAIDENGTTHVLSKNNSEIQFDRSAGENQIFATALIAGLAEVSKIKAPLVVDTPLGRLDSKHRQNILNFWIGDTSRQVILLSQDEEISSNFYQQIEQNVSATFLLSHENIGDGFGRTTVIPSRYFGDLA